MNIKKQFLLLLFFFPAMLPAQIFDKDSVFILERKTLELGKTISGKNKNAVRGFTARVSTGYMSNSISNNYYNKAAAVVPLSLEFGYQFYFLELGFRHSRTGIALGTDASGARGTGSSTIRTTYPIPANVGIQTNLAVATFHIPIKRIPFFFNIGLGQSDYTLSGKTVVQNYYTDGSSGYVFNNTFSGIPQLKTWTSILGIGFSNGPFFGGMEWWRLRGKRDEFDYRYKNGYQQMFLGLQMNTATAKGKKKNQVLAKKDHLQIGISKMVLLAPWRRSGTGTAFSADIAMKISPKAQLAASFQFDGNRHGYEKYIPETDSAFGRELLNPAGALKRQILYAGYLLNPSQLMRAYIYSGLGYYRIKIKEENPWIDPGFPSIDPSNTQHTGGAVFGAGFQYKYVHSQVLFHQPFNAAPLIMEWNLGGRIVF